MLQEQTAQSVWHAGSALKFVRAARFLYIGAAMRLLMRCAVSAAESVQRNVLRAVLLSGKGGEIYNENEKALV